MLHRHFFRLSIIILSVFVFSAFLTAHSIQEDKSSGLNIDFSGVEKFLEPTQEQWDGFTSRQPIEKGTILLPFQKKPCVLSGLWKNATSAN